MRIAIHDSEAEHLRNKNKFPNLALMKISACHKGRGDTVEWWNPIEEYDIVYSSKVFTFTPVNKYLPPDTIKGGTGYDIKIKLPSDIETALFPDYSIYPNCDYAIGFVTRGCVRNCPWCVVPEKERREVYFDRSPLRNSRNDSDKLILMDNNILAYPQVEALLQSVVAESRSKKIDFNQGLDCRLVTPKIADWLIRINWIKYIRFACDSFAMVKPLTNAVNLLKERGVLASKIYVYLLVSDIDDAMKRVKELRKLGAITLCGQAYRDFRNGGEPVSKEASYFAQKYLYSGQWRKVDWYDTYYARKFLKGGEKE